jgi:hypothetical protein
VKGALPVSSAVTAGKLPFTGAPLIWWLLAAFTLLAAGTATRRCSRCALA